MKLAFLAIALLAISCAPKAKKKEFVQRDPICGAEKSTNCGRIIEWNLVTRETNLPKNLSVKVNDHEVGNDCVSETSIRTARNDQNQTYISFHMVSIPQADKELTVEITDLGDNCDHPVIYDRVVNPRYVISAQVIEGHEFISLFFALN
jgi:hypothetical protein